MASFLTIITRRFSGLLISLLLASCAMSGDPSDWAGAEFSLIKSPFAPTNYLHILYNEYFGGTVSYIVSSTSLDIKNKKEFDASTAVKTTVNVTSPPEAFNGIELTPMLHYIRTGWLAAGRKYYVYVLDVEAEVLTALTESTMASADNYPADETGTIRNFADTADIPYTISYPAGYSLSSDKWPILLSVKGPNPTSGDHNFPCITFNIDISWSSNSQFLDEIAKVKALFNAYVNDADHRVDKNRIYGFGFSAGAGVVIKIANENYNSPCKFAALAINGVSDWAGSDPDWTGNLGYTNIWTSMGEGDPYGADVFHRDMPKYAGDHFFSTFPGVAHSSGPAWASPYTWIWMLSKGQ